MSNIAKKVCVITDNRFLYEKMQSIIETKGYDCTFDFFCSRIGKPSPLKGVLSEVRLKEESLSFFKSYDLFLSLHCKQIFPDELVKNVRCVNVHP